MSTRAIACAIQTHCVAIACAIQTSERLQYSRWGNEDIHKVSQNFLLAVVARKQNFQPLLKQLAVQSVQAVEALWQPC